MGILGLESYNGNKPKSVGLTGCVSTPYEKELPEIRFRQYKFELNGTDENSPAFITYADGEGLAAVANKKSFNTDGAVLKRLESYGYIKKTDSGYIPSIMVIRKEKLRKMPNEAKKQLELLRHKAAEIATRHYLFCREQIYKEIPDALKKDEFQISHTCANVFAMRGAVLEEAVKQGYLTFNKSGNNKALGAYLVI